jgi:hypothetical protein
MKNDNCIAAKVRVYAQDEEEYYSFTTKEAYDTLREWMNYRKESGEEVTKDSWLMRSLWDVTTPRGKGVVTIPKKLKSSGVKRLMERALWAQGLRSKLPAGRRRHEFQADHGFRKWFKTRCEIGGMKSINVETLMGHSIGIQDSYYRATSDELLQDYLKATSFLNIDDRYVLQKQVDKMKDSRQQQKDSEILEWKKKYLKDVKGLIEQMNTMKEVQQETQRELGEIKRFRASLSRT